VVDKFTKRRYRGDGTYFHPSCNGVKWSHGPERLPEVNIRQANGIGRVHVAKPQMRETYCGRPVNEEDWVTTSKEANCTGCARAGAPMPEGSKRGS
jgi:hypothetical protein